jgi:cobalt-zinc-cadmium efflux system protein
MDWLAALRIPEAQKPLTIALRLGWMYLNAGMSAGHSHDHDHDDHSHGAAHSHAPKEFNTAFAIGVSLNLLLVIAQVIYGTIAHSLALVADAGHNFADVLGLIMAWWASRLAKTIPTKNRTYGLRSASILAALANAIILLISMGAVAWEAIVRLEHPAAVQGEIVIWLAALGIVVNGISAMLFFSGRKGDLNVRAAFMHLIADAAMSAGVVLAGVAIVWTNKLWIDPVMSLIIVGTIIYGTWGLFKDSINLSLHAVPASIDCGEVESYLRTLPTVRNIHDLHIWAMSTTQTALTVHLVMEPARVDNNFLEKVCADLREKFGIEHPTVQIEHDDPHHQCSLASRESG